MSADVNTDRTSARRTVLFEEGERAHPDRDANRGCRAGEGEERDGAVEGFRETHGSAGWVAHASVAECSTW